MALTTCKECSKEISKKAQECPHCGNPASKGASIGGAFKWLFIILFGITVFNIATKHNDPSSTGKPPVKKTAPIDPETRKIQLNYIHKLQDAGFINNIEKPGTYPHIYVSNVFHQTPFKLKEKSLNIVYAYYFPNQTDGIIVINDNQTGQKIGTYVLGYLSLD